MMRRFHTAWILLTVLFTSCSLNIHDIEEKIKYCIIFKFFNPEKHHIPSPLSALSHSRDEKLYLWQFHSSFTADIFTNNSECLPGYWRRPKNIQIATVWVIFVDEPPSCQTVCIHCSQHGGQWSDVTASLAQSETRTAQVSPVPRAWTGRSLLMLDCTVVVHQTAHCSHSNTCFELWRELACHFDKSGLSSLYPSSQLTSRLDTFLE